MKKISNNERKKLIEFMHTHKNYLVRKKAHFLLLKSKNYKNDLLQRIFEISDKTIIDWTKEWDSEAINSLKLKDKKGQVLNKKKLTI